MYFSLFYRIYEINYVPYYLLRNRKYFIVRKIYKNSVSLIRNTQIKIGKYSFNVTLI